MFDFNEVPMDDRPRLEHGHVGRFKIHIQPGNYTDLFKGLPDNIATEGQNGAVYINIKLVDEHNNFVYHRIGIHSPKGPNFTNMGKRDIRRILDSHYGLASDDASDAAMAKRKIRDLSAIDGMTVTARLKMGEKYLEVDRFLTVDDVPF